MLVNSHQRSNRGALAKWKKWYWKRWVNSRVMSCPGSLSLSLPPSRFRLALFTCPLSVSFHPRTEQRGARLCSREYAPASRSSAGTSCSHGRGPGRSSFEFENTAISVTAPAAALCVHTYVYPLASRAKNIVRSCVFFLSKPPRCRRPC